MSETHLPAIAAPHMSAAPAHPHTPEVDTWAQLQAGTLHILQTITIVTLTGAVSCVAVHYLLPVMLRLLMRPVQDGIWLLAATALLPEYLLTTALRTTGRPPLAAAYAFDDAIIWSAQTARSTAELILRLSSRTAQRVHPAVTALIAGGIALRVTLGSA